jgi:hypothetical protein
MLAAGHVRLVALGNTLDELVVIEEVDAITGEDMETEEGVTTVDEGVDVIVGVVVELDFLVVLLTSGQVAPGLQPLNPFWQT